MSSVKNLVSTLKELSEINKSLSDLKSKVCEMYCPYKVGDIVTIRGHSHEGKSGRVTKVYLTAGWEGKIDFKITADVLRKDGSASNFKAEWNSYNDDNLKFALDNINKEIKN